MEGIQEVSGAYNHHQAPPSGSTLAPFQVVTPQDAFLSNSQPRGASQTLQEKRSETALKDRSSAISSCVKDVAQAFPLPSIIETDTDRRAQSHLKIKAHYWYCNEYTDTHDSPFNFRRTIDAIAQKLKEPNDRLGIGIVVGESSLLACLPELRKHCDIIFMLDYDHLILHCHLKRLEEIQHCHNIGNEENFHSKLHDFMFNISGRGENTKKHIYRCLNYGRALSKKRLQKYDPFSSNDRLEEVKESAKNTHFVPVYCNLFSKESMQTLSRIIRRHNGEIQIFNFSNAMEYHEYFYSTSEFCFDNGPPLTHKEIKEWPVSKNALCCFSTIGDRNNQNHFMSPERCWPFLEQLARKRALYPYHPDKTVLEELKKSIIKNYTLQTIQLLLASASYEHTKELHDNKACLFDIIDGSQFSPLHKEQIKRWVSTTISHHIKP